MLVFLPANGRRREGGTRKVLIDEEGNLLPGQVIEYESPQEQPVGEDTGAL